MTDFTIWALVLNIIYLGVTLATIRAMLWYFDRSLGIGFKKDVLDKIEGNPLAVSLYFSLRFFAVCYLASAFLS